jgi:hypothetical protein
MVAFLTRFSLALRSRFKARAKLEAENAVLRQQVLGPCLKRSLTSFSQPRRLFRLVIATEP